VGTRGPWRYPVLRWWIGSSKLVDPAVQGVGRDLLPVGELVESRGREIQEESEEDRGLAGCLLGCLDLEEENPQGSGCDSLVQTIRRKARESPPGSARMNHVGARHPREKENSQGQEEGQNVDEELHDSKVPLGVWRDQAGGTPGVRIGI
jgi:hypothetical protein